MTGWPSTPPEVAVGPFRIPPILAAARLVFWDFDGVVKESVSVKEDGFVHLVRGSDEEVADRVRRHHRENGGVSRFEKIPLYLQWSGAKCDREAVEQACTEFSRVVYDMVISSPWVPGVRDYLLSNPGRQEFCLLSATPQLEIDSILIDLDLRDCFTQVFGAPRDKAEVIVEVMGSRGLEPEEVLFVGDSSADIQAAGSSGIPFLLRRDGLAEPSSAGFEGPSFGDLING